MATKEAESMAFKLSLQQSLPDPFVMEEYQVIFKPIPNMDALQQSNSLEAKIQEFADLCREVDSLKVDKSFNSQADNENSKPTMVVT